MILVTGGARSGKSRHAEALIGDSSQVLYIAMVTNLLFDYGGDKDPDEWDYQAMEQAINAEIQSLIAACQRCPAKVVLVTNEVGMGIVPESRLARHFRDIAGRVNQQLAAAANEVWLVVSGIGVKIK